MDTASVPWYTLDLCICVHPHYKIVEVSGYSAQILFKEHLIWWHGYASWTVQASTIINTTVLCNRRMFATSFQ